MTSVAELFGHFSNIVYLVGSIIKGSLALRVSWVVGSLAELVYYVYIAPQPLWTSIIWCGVIMGLNIYQIILLLLQRRKSSLSPREQQLYKQLFNAMAIGNFKKMMKKAQWDVPTQDRIIITQNQPVDTLFLLAVGEADIRLDGNAIARVNSGSFMGEMSLLTGQLPSATVEVRAGATLISWPKADIDKLQQADESLHNELYAVFSRDIIEKIKRQNLQLAG